MTAPIDAILALVHSARGSRPQSLDDREVEEVLNIALALLVELAVSNDRIDRLERFVAEQGGMTVEALRDTAYDGAAADERQQATDALLARVLRILIDPRVPTDGRPER
ncbi:MAG: hypothetical protein V4564_11385 [Pseudomonadota bacterium]